MLRRPEVTVVEVAQRVSGGPEVLYAPTRAFATRVVTVGAVMLFAACAHLFGQRDETPVIAADVERLATWTKGLPLCAAGAGQVGAVEGELMATRATCTRLACPDGRRCCNQCFLDWYVVREPTSVRLRSDVLRSAPSVFECSAGEVTTMLSKIRVRATGAISSVPNPQETPSLEMNVDSVCVTVASRP